jgi:hypothetical protein
LSPLAREGNSLTIIAECSVPSCAQIKHLKYLEAESIGIMREAVAEFRNPVMFYSIGNRGQAALFRRAAAGGQTQRHLDYGRRRAAAAKARRAHGNAVREVPYFRMLSADRSD